MVPAELVRFGVARKGKRQSQPLFGLKSKLLVSALDVLVGCGCEVGCPACVGPVGEVGESGKQATLRLLRELLAGQRTNS